MRFSTLFICLPCVLVQQPTEAGDWPQFLGPDRNGIARDADAPRPWPKDGPKLLWRKNVGEGYSGPVVAGDRLIVFHRVGNDEVVESWNAADGKFQWKFAYPCDYQDQMGKGNGPRATPTVARKRIVTMGANGDLTCISLEDGAKLWTRNVNKDYGVPESYFGVGSSPAVDDGLVLVNVGGKGAGIVAFGLEDGKEMWKATSDGASYSSPVVCSVAGVKCGVFFTRNGVVILDPKNGAVRHTQRWRARYDASVNAATPLVFGEQVFFSASYETGALVLGLRKDGADEVWSSEDLMSNHYNTCVFHKGHLYGFDGRQESGPAFRCVNVSNKKIKWNAKRFGCGSFILAKEKLLIMKEDGVLTLADANPEEYVELARARILESGPVRAQIALAHGRLYARDQKHMACFDLQK